MHTSNEIFPSFITLFVIWQVRRFLDTKTTLPHWDRTLRRFWIINLIAIGVSLAIDSDVPLRLMWLLTLGIVGYTVRLLNDNFPARILLLALAPFMFFVGTKKLINNAFPAFVKVHDDVFDALTVFTAVWLFTFFIIARRQKKALLKAEQQREADAAERRKIEAQKAELEALVAERTTEITARKEALEQALNELKATQDQLIQKEKMASLGELTAGIAHEIQNPLNFVNNFSEVSAELVTELEEEREKGRAGVPGERDEELEAEILSDLKQNLQKIAHHGSRASSIVRSMLQHSRTGTGEKRPTDLNALADEYFKIAYHGLRAKDPTFNCALVTDFDPALGPVNIMLQELGRVLLNLFNNAFYAVQEKQKTAPADYQPTVTISTRQCDDQIEIRVRDNGTGMPESVKTKIFQPFFTTKPTGEGTGLGLSLSYDIVTKGHGGSLTVDSVADEFTEFLVIIPK